MEKNSNIPVVSIIVPCYNQGKYLAESLSSILNQSFENWECIIVNDGSVDDTEIIANEFLVKDSRFKYIFQVNSGVSAARNHGIQRSEGVFILPLDADDKIKEFYIESAVKSFDTKDDLKIVYGKARKFGEINENWNLPDFKLSTLLRGNIIYNCAMFRRDNYLEIGGYDEKLTKGYEDWDFWISMMKNGGSVYQIPEICFLYRIKRNSRNHQLDECDIEELAQYITIKHIDIYVETFGSYKNLLTQLDLTAMEREALKKELNQHSSKFIRIKNLFKKS